MTNPKLGTIRRRNGVAGQYSLSVTVTYPDEPSGVVTFVGSVYGGPVVMQTPGLPDGVFVSSPERFGRFGTEWVRRFFNAEV